MSPFKRKQRATAKQRAKTGRRTASGVPPELRPTGYGFPHVELPPSRPLVDHKQLRAALDDEPTEQLPKAVERGGECGQRHLYRIWCAALDAHIGGTFDTAQAPRVQYDLISEDDEPLWDVVHPDGSYCIRESQLQEILSFGEPVLSGVVLPDEPQPAAAPGLEPVRASIAAAVDGLVTEMRERGLPTEPVTVHIGNALPPRLTAWEQDLLHGDDTLVQAIRDTPHAPADPWARWEHELADVWADIETRFRAIDKLVHGKSAFDDDIMRRRSEDMRKHLVGGDLAAASDRMHEVYAEGGTAELTGLAASLARMIVANAKAQPAGVSQ